MATNVLDITATPGADEPPARGGGGKQKLAARDPMAPRGWAAILQYALLVIAGLIALFPFYAMLVMSLRAPGVALSFPGSLVPTDLTFEHYQEIWATGKMPRWIVNTVIYSFVSVFFVLLFAAMAGYGFAKKRFRGREVLFWLFVAMVMVPYHVTLIPQFMLISEMGGVNTYWGLILPTLVNVQATFLMRQFITSIPDELIEAAKVDGASELRIFLTIIVPLCKPILATLGLFVFLWHWNDFLWPLVVAQSEDVQVLTVGVARMLQENAPLSTTLAGSAIALAPILIAYLFASRYFTEGAVMSGVKG
ncbi:MAG TPA: carbohydrate ABC transporter permease [Geminicoccaceae bacterium]|nr:carbohydrate ABC transporter permease [Geminicoccaceae bacterium]